jgi:acetyl-CoA carboxylase carboxyl transferase subunit beta
VSTMAWFKRAKYGLQPAAKKKDIPDVWLKCENCGEILYKKEMVRNFFVCTKCDFHFRINSQDYINLLLDDGIFEEFNSSMQSVDVLKFKDSKRYSDRLKEAVKKSGLYEAVLTGFGNVKGIKVVLCVMDFSFVGGSMGSVVGEKIARATDKALENRFPDSPMLKFHIFQF